MVQASQNPEILPQSVPEDLSVWVGQAILQRLALEVVGELSSRHDIAGSVEKPLAGNFPHRMLVALAYYYSSGVYSSGDIAQRLLIDDIGKCYFGQFAPAPEDVMRFRRRWRSVIKDCLVRLFRLARQHCHAVEQSKARDPAEYLFQKQNDAVGTPWDRCFIDEAEERISQAVLLDAADRDI